MTLPLFRASSEIVTRKAAELLTVQETKKPPKIKTTRSYAERISFRDGHMMAIMG